MSRPGRYAAKGRADRRLQAEHRRMLLAPALCPGSSTQVPLASATEGLPGLASFASDGVPQGRIGPAVPFA